jgi:hypothetical protein
MAAAANFAFAKRQLITHSTRQAFASAGFDPGDRPLRVLCDLAHNNAKFEEHDGREVLVHRKGATRRFGPGNEELPERYRPVGQPVLVPGAMGRYSYVLAGTEGAMGETFGSGAPGAGRKMGRRAGGRRRLAGTGAGHARPPDRLLRRQHGGGGRAGHGGKTPGCAGRCRRARRTPGSGGGGVVECGSVYAAHRRRGRACLRVAL